MRTFTVELTEEEIRALVNTANLWIAVVPADLIETVRRPEHPLVPPLMSAAMRLEQLMICEGIES